MAKTDWKVEVIGGEEMFKLTHTRYVNQVGHREFFEAEAERINMAPGRKAVLRRWDGKIAVYTDLSWMPKGLRRSVCSP